MLLGQKNVKHRQQGCQQKEADEKRIVAGGVEIPQEFYGIPILYTDSLIDNEAQVS